MIGSSGGACGAARSRDPRFHQIQRPDVSALLRHHLDPGRDLLSNLGAPSGAGAEIESRTLTFLMFSDYGMPVTFYNDHYDLLLSQDYLSFARKISPRPELKRRLGDALLGQRGGFPDLERGAEPVQAFSPDGAGSGGGLPRGSGRRNRPWAASAS
jgi:hypothetical protein